MPPDFDREIHCVLGLPFDAVSKAEAVQYIRDAAANRTPCFLSTPNLNFLIASQTDESFRNSVINSNLSITDGMPIVWIARLLGIPVKERVAGSDLFALLNTESPIPLSVYFFGGIEGVAENACQQLNADSRGLKCAGFEYPGFASIQEMSNENSINKINASGADFLIVSLGAKKGQTWIELNRAKISVPVISHLGAVVNFVAGKLDRAPIFFQRTGLEWLWRIKEEPPLWRRYVKDGISFIRLLATRVLPYAWLMYQHRQTFQKQNSVAIDLYEDDSDEIIVRLSGEWDINNLTPLRKCFSSLAFSEKNVKIELENVTYVDSAFLGLIMLMYGCQLQLGRRLSIVNMSNRVKKIFRYSCTEFLLKA